MADSETLEVKETANEVESTTVSAEVKEATPETTTTTGVDTASASAEGVLEAAETTLPVSPGEKGAKEEKKKPPRKRPSPKKDGPKKDEQRKDGQKKDKEKEKKKDDQREGSKEGDVVPVAEDSNAEGGEKAAVESPRVKKTPYVNPDRVNTGGQQKEKLTEEELTKRMERIRLNNEKIKERRLAVEADEQAFKASQEALRQKQQAERRIQEGINRSREQNALRKMEKIQGREWDNEKNQRGGGTIQSPARRGRGRGGRQSTPHRAPAAKADDSDAWPTETAPWLGDNANTSANAPAETTASTETSFVPSPSLTRDAPPHTEARPGVAAEESGR